MKLKKGDKVLIIAGKDRGKTGLVERVIPTTNRIVVAGINAYKKHVKPSTKNPQGGIVESYRSLNASNAMILDATTNKPTRIGYKIEGQDKVRIARSTNQLVGK